METATAMDSALVLRMGTHVAETPPKRKLGNSFLGLRVALFYTMSFIYRPHDDGLRLAQ